MKKLFLFVFVVLSFTGVIAVLAANGFASPPQDEYSPSKYALPSELAGYRVLAVINEENFACLNPGEKRLVLQSEASSSEQLLSSVNNQEIIQALQKNNIHDIENWSWSVVDSKVNRDVTVRLLRESYMDDKKNGCTQLGGPIVEPTQPR